MFIIIFRPINVPLSTLKRWKLADFAVQMGMRKAKVMTSFKLKIFNLDFIIKYTYLLISYILSGLYLSNRIHFLNIILLAKKNSKK